MRYRIEVPMDKIISINRMGVRIGIPMKPSIGSQEIFDAIIELGESLKRKPHVRCIACGKLVELDKALYKCDGNYDIRIIYCSNACAVADNI